MAGGTGLQQQHLVARVRRKPVRDDRAGRSGADNDVVVGLHLITLVLPPSRLQTPLPVLIQGGHIASQESIEVWCAGDEGETGMNDPVDVLIIGAGASGAAVAWSLAETRMHILCLEQGGWMNPATIPSTGRDWEARVFGDYSPSPNIRARPEDYPINDDNSPIKVVNFNGVGGGTVMYTAHFPRLHPSDFRVRTLDGVADDWPIDYDTLAPFFAENDRMMGVSGPRRRSRRPAARAADAAAAARPLRRDAGQGDEPARLALVAVRHRGRDRRIRGPRALHQSRPLHARPARRGRRRAPTSPTGRRRMRAGVELRTHCRVREITTNEHGMAAGVVYYDADGIEQFQPAEVVVLACNGVGTPRLLLNSASGRFPERARQFQRAGRQEPDVPSLRPGLRLCRRADRQQPRAADLPVEQGVLRDRPVARLRARLHVPVRPRRRAGRRGGHQRSRRACCPGARAITPSSAASTAIGSGLSAICEDLPEEHNRVTLDPVLKDSHGIPAPRIDYTIGENTARMMEHGIARAKEILAAAEATDICVNSPILYGGWHLLGTARMGTDPARSVVNEWGRSHDVKNLFIVDGSVFVTSGGVNPTSTIQALALYIADQMKQRLANLFD